MNKSLRIVFMGTPGFALSPLRALCEAGYKPVAVYTQPDRVNGRGGKISFSPVKQYALEQEIPVCQPFSFKEETALSTLRAWSPDLIVVIAYGKILPQAVLDIPTYGAVNIHASLLPKYRGAAPVQRAILNREEETGVSLMKLDAGMDTGPVISSVRTAIGDTVTSGELLEILADLGAKELLRILPILPDALAAAVPQDESRATYAEKITKEMSALVWTDAAADLHARIRALSPNPGTYTVFRGKRVKIHRSFLTQEETTAAPGTVVSTDKKGILVATGEGVLGISRLQPENKKEMDAADWLRGAKVQAGERFGTEDGQGAGV